MGSHTGTGRERRPHRYLQSTTASETTCRECRRPILNAWDEGLLVRVELEPLGDVGAVHHEEAQAILAGRYTYVRPASGDLILRTAERITSGHPAGKVHASHVCPDRRVQADLLELLP